MKKNQSLLLKTKEKVKEKAKSFRIKKQNSSTFNIPTRKKRFPSFGQWRFVGCYCKQVGDVGFDYTSGDPIIVPITFGCLALDETGLGGFAT